MRHRMTGWMMVLVAAFGLAGSHAGAAQLYWDTVPGDGGTDTGGDGHWDNQGNTNWNDGSGNVQWNNSTPDEALFEDGSGTITVDEPITTGALRFGYGISGPYTLVGDTITVVNGSDQHDIFSTQNLIISNNLVVPSGQTVTMRERPGKTITLSGVISGGGALRCDTAGGDGIYLMADNTFSGGFGIGAPEGADQAGGADIFVASDTAFGSGRLTFAKGHAITALGAPRTFTNTLDNDYNPNSTFTFAGFDQTYTGDWEIHATARTTDGSVTIDVQNSLTTFSGDLSLQSGRIMPQFIKTGPGTLVLSGNNTYVADNVVNQGALLVNNATGSGLGNNPVGVNAGTTLGGTGVVAGTVTVAGNGTITAGGEADSVGVLSVGGLVLEANAVIRCEYSASANDRIDVSGTVSLPAAATVATTNLASAAYGEAVLISAASPLSGDVSGWTVTGPLAGRTLLIDGNELLIKPPPSGTIVTIR